MCHFLAPAGQPEMMHKNFMHWHLRIFVVQCSRMKFYDFFRKSSARSTSNIRTAVLSSPPAASHPA